MVFGHDRDADVLTLWVFGTYLMDVWRLFPKVLIQSPTKRCGKTTLLEVLEATAYRGMMCSNITAPSLFRSIDKWRPTLIVDEADRFLRDAPELNGIINAGHTRRTAFVNRCVEIDGVQDVRRFSVWGAQVFASIGSQMDTLVDRSLVIGLRRKLPTEMVERMPFDLHERMLGTRRRLARWAADHAIQIAAMEIEPGECGNDRRRDNYTPPWRIADALGGAWPARIAAAYSTPGGDNEEEPAAIMLLRDLYNVFAERGAERLQSTEMVNKLIGLDDRPWGDWKNGRPMTAQSIARLLRPFEVRSRNVREGGQVLKSYFAADVRAAFERYAANPTREPLPRYHHEDKGKNGYRSRYPDANGSGSESQKIEQYQNGSGVAGNFTGPVACHPPHVVDRAIRGAWEAFEAMNDPNNPDTWQ